MRLTHFLTLSAIVFAAPTLAESEAPPMEEPRATQGRAQFMAGTTTIQANEEEPMTTIIMPWRDSAPVELDDKPIQLVTEELLPIDPEVFRRQFQYYNAPR